MGLISFLKRLFGRKSDDDKPAAASKAVAKPAAKKAPAKKAPARKAPARKAPAKKTPAASKSLRPQCAAVTPAGAQCKNSAREGSKYCGSHKGYRPKAADAGAKDTKPRVTKAKDTAPTGRKSPARKPAAKKAAPKQVSSGDYLLYQSGQRFFFSKKKTGDKGWKKVNKVPAGRFIKVTGNGLPVLAKK